MSAQKSLDAISLEIFRNALESIVDECFVALMKSSYSSNIKERRDHSVALFDRRGRLVAQAKDSLPIHLSSLGGLIGALLSSVPADDLAPLHEGTQRRQLAHDLHEVDVGAWIVV